LQQRRRGSAERERFPGRQESVSLPGLRSGATWENGVEHSGSLCFADTEEVTGSNPVAPTIVLLSRAFADSDVPWMPLGPVAAHAQRQESISLFNQGCSLLRAAEPVSGPPVPPPPAQTSIQRPRRQLVGTYEAKTDGIQALASRIQAFGGTDLVESPELIQEHARWPEAHSPTSASAPSGGVVFGPRRAVALRTEPNHHCGSAHDRGIAHPGVRVGGNRPADQHYPGSTRSRCTPAHSSPWKNWVESRAARWLPSGTRDRCRDGSWR
jgi:hypothetical protein